MKNLRIFPGFVLIVFALILSLCSVAAAESSRINEKAPYRHSIDFSPLSPVFNIYAIHYTRHLSEHDDFIVGPAYTNIPYDFGETRAASLILGYRRYLWKNLHLEYQLWPDYDWFYESNEDKTYPGFDLWNEFRLGYRVDFTLGELPCYINFQWPFGFGLYAANKPESFKQKEAEEPYFYFPPMFFLGVKF